MSFLGREIVRPIADIRQVSGALGPILISGALGPKDIDRYLGHMSRDLCAQPFPCEDILLPRDWIVGSTKATARHTKHPLYHWMARMGLHNIHITVLEGVTPWMADITEVRWMHKFPLKPVECVHTRSEKGLVELVAQAKEMGENNPAGQGVATTPSRNVDPLLAIHSDSRGKV